MILIGIGCSSIALLLAVVDYRRMKRARKLQNSKKHLLNYANSTPNPNEVIV